MTASKSSERRYQVADTIPPEDSLLSAFLTSHYADAYRVTLPGQVSLHDWLLAFLESRVFRCERWVLGRFPGGHSTSEEVCALASGQAQRFAVWRVVERTEHELLMADATGSTRSWWRCDSPTGQLGTELYFGSAIITRTKPGSTGRRTLGLTRLIIPAHRHYSRLLVRSAAGRLQRDQNATR